MAALLPNCTVLNEPSPAICGVQYTYWRYLPDKNMGIFFTFLFGAEMLVLLVVPFLARLRRGGPLRALYMHTATFCALCEMIGWIGRIMGASPTGVWRREQFLLQAVLLAISPVFISAANYLVCEHVVNTVGGKELPIEPQWLTPVFVGGDFVSLVIQGTGGGLAASQDPVNQDRGNKTLMAGVCLQTAVTMPFMCLFGLYLLRHYRLYQQQSNRLPLHLTSTTSLMPTPSIKDANESIALDKLPSSSSELTLSLESPCVPTRRASGCWTPGLIRLALGTMISSAFILLRCFYRIAEMGMGWNGYLNQHQYFLLFDTVPIALAIAIFCVYHPAFLLP